MKPEPADPFVERRPAPFRARLSVLGGAFTIESTDEILLRLALEAFGGLPRHRLARAPKQFHLSLVGGDLRATWPPGTEPPHPTHSAGGGLLCATIDAGNFAIVDLAQARALVSISRGMLRYPYHARYELIELAVLTLASRGQALVPLHAACVGARGLGILLMGPSGAGKSTLSLHALAGGMRLLSEDSAFVAVNDLRVTGVPNYLHVQTSALRSLSDEPLRRQIRGSPKIRRRSGIWKYEFDLRRVPRRLATAPLWLAATVFLSPRPAASGPALKQLGPSALRSRLHREQPYAAGLASWRSFEKRIVKIPAYEMRRPEHPEIAIRELRALLAMARMRS